tara:strand:+ start:986 stop:1408 length:423 start_codon:yes stop_codon:yes gene_type:complete
MSKRAEKYMDTTFLQDTFMESVLDVGAEDFFHRALLSDTARINYFLDVFDSFDPRVDSEWKAMVLTAKTLGIQALYIEERTDKSLASASRWLNGETIPPINTSSYTTFNRSAVALVMRQYILDLKLEADANLKLFENKLS